MLGSEKEPTHILIGADAKTVGELRIEISKVYF
jgi:hypothetical protein